MNNTIARLIRTGFFHIFGAGTINKIIATLTSIILVRVMSKDSYGVYAYVYNIVSFFLLFNGLGASSALLQLCSELHEDETSSKTLFQYGVKYGVYFDVLLAVALLIAGLVAPLSFSTSRGYLIAYSLYPTCILLFELHQTWLRVQLENITYAKMTTAQTVFMAVFSAIGAIIGNVWGLIIGQYVSYLLAWILMRKKGNSLDIRINTRLETGLVKEYWRVSLISSLNNGLGQALTLIGTFMVGTLIANEAMVADYKVASTIPFALLFIPSALVVYIYPYFVHHKEDRAWTLKRYKQLMLASVLSMGLITVIFVLCGPFLVKLIFGEEYLPAVPAYRVLMIGFFITASVRQPTGNLLVTQRKLGFNFIMGLISVLACITLSNILIPQFDLLGAALAYDGVMLIGAVCNVVYYLRTVRAL